VKVGDHVGKSPLGWVASLPASVEQANGLWGRSHNVIASRRAGTTHILSSAQGVRQGDSLGPLLFSLAIRPLFYLLPPSPRAPGMANNTGC
jgi:hypothetical protein